MQLDKFLSQGQTQSSALNLVRIVGAHLAKLLENFRLIFRRDPDAGVSYRYFDRAIALLGVDSDPPSLGSELDRVRKQIQKDLLDLTLVADELAEPLVEIDVECNAMAFPSRSRSTTSSIPQTRAALSTMASRTGCTSVGERLMMPSTSAVAV